MSVKKALFLLFICCGTLTKVDAHGGGFYEQCDSIPTPNCPDNQYNWHDVTSTDSALYFVGGNGYCYIYYFKGGIKLLHTISSDTLTGVQFLTNSIGYAWGKNGTLIKTTDAGLNWNFITTNTSANISNVEFIDENIAYLMVGDTIKKTNNGGTSWDLLVLPVGITFKDFHFFDAQNGQICGQQTTSSIAGFLYQTINGGSSWTQIYTDTCAFTKLDYTNATTGYLYGTTINQPLLFETVNSGTDWTIKYTSASWSIKSNIVTYNNVPVFATQESTGVYFYNLSHFLDVNFGVVINPVKIYTTNFNGVETLYIISTIGLYRYTTGKAVCNFISFTHPAIIPHSSNPYNIMAPGKTLRFKAILANTSTDTVASITGKIRCKSPYITIRDSIAIYKDIPANLINSVNRAWSDDWYEIKLDSTIPNNYVIHLEFIYENRVPYSSTLDRSIKDFPYLNSPFILTNITVLDTENNSNIFGNNNGTVEIGETTALEISLKNTSLHYFYGIDGQLRSAFPQLTIWDNIDYPDSTGDKVYNRYSIGSFNPNQTTMPVGNYVVTNTFEEDYQLPFTLITKGTFSDYIDDLGCSYSSFFSTHYCWGNDFYLNNSLSLPPDSLISYGIPFEDTVTSNPVPISAIYNIEKAVELIVYPNPNDGNFILKNFKSFGLNDTDIEIYDVLGQLVKYEAQEANASISINIKNTPSGFYFLRINTSNFKHTIKIIKY